MKPVVTVAIAALSFGGARFAREEAVASRTSEVTAEPFAPSPSTAQMLSLGYRELLADLLFVRLAGYVGGTAATPDAVAALAEGTAAADPFFRRIYAYGAQALLLVAPPKNMVPYAKRAIALYELGARRFPTFYRFPLEAGEIYLVDMKSENLDEQRKWEQEGIRLVEKGMHMPGAPAMRATYIAELRSRLGQHQRAIDGLREMYLTTSDAAAQAKIIEKIAALEKDSAADVANDIQLQRHRFEQDWKAIRPAVPPTWFVLLGARLPRTFDMGDLATGGFEVIEPLEEPLEPLTD